MKHKKEAFDLQRLIDRIEAEAGQSSYDRIAEAAGVRKETLWRIRNGKQNPTVKLANQIFNAIYTLETNRATAK